MQKRGWILFHGDMCFAGGQLSKGDSPALYCLHVAYSSSVTARSQLLSVHIFLSVL